MRRAVAVSIAMAMGGVGCNSIVGNDPHQLAMQSTPEGGAPSDAAVLPDAADSGGPLEAATDAPGSGPGNDAASGNDGAPEEAGSEGGAVTPTSGGIYTVGRVPNDASVGALPDGGLVTLTDDGFEFGETLCVDAGTGLICLTGALTP